MNNSLQIKYKTFKNPYPNSLNVPSPKRTNPKRNLKSDKIPQTTAPIMMCKLMDQVSNISNPSMSLNPTAHSLNVLD